MPAINGKQYIDRIDALSANIWYNGRKVTGKLSEHPAFKGVMHETARLFDLQTATDWCERSCFHTDRK